MQIGSTARIQCAYGVVSVRVSHVNTRFQEIEGIILRGKHKDQHVLGTLAPAKPVREAKPYRAAMPTDTVTVPDSHRFTTRKLNQHRNFPGERPTHLISN